MKPYAIVVSGLPGSGKTSLAEALAAELGLPWVSKDRVKEVLADSLGLSVERSHDLGRAAVQVLLSFARAAPQVIVESFFWPGLSEPELLALDRPLVQIHCRCDPTLARARFNDRANMGNRHHVHHDFDDWEQFSAGAGRLDLPGALIEIQTAEPVDVDRVAAMVRAALRTADQSPRP